MTSDPGTIFRFTTDAGGLTPLDIADGGNDSLFGAIDMDSLVAPTVGQTFTLIESTGGADYSNLTLDPSDVGTWSLITGGEDLQAQYVIPEPGAMGLGLAGAAGLFVFLRRQRRQG